jgi:type II secretory pathway pseudopilin PulG
MKTIFIILKNKFGFLFERTLTLSKNIKNKLSNIPPGNSGGFSLIEIIIVLGLIMFIYSVALPNFSLSGSAATANKLGQFGSDVRNAYDLSVLSRKTYRMVFRLNTGDYWLEVADRKYVKMGAVNLDRDLNPDEEKELQLSFDNDFAEFEELGGTMVVDPETDTEIKPESPVVNSKEKLRPPQWTKVDSMEWGQRSFGPDLMILKMQAEHHSNVQDLLEMGEDAVGMIHFFPSGRTERAYLHLHYKSSDMVPDEDEEPYTIIINPHEGTADITTGLKEIDVHEDPET